jgi:SSS family solute:Na+ symporter
MDPFLYQYAVGGVVFTVGMVYAARQGYVGLRGRSLLHLVVLIGGLGAFAGVQGYLQYAPMQTGEAIAYEGGYARGTTLGTPLDYGVVIAYFLVILAVGTWFGRGQRTTRDFFFGGQRFAWWVIAMSLIATTVGSYSFVKYSRVAFEHGLSSSQTYLNDWFWMPLLVFGWLPILYFSRITSIPEYFGRRFGPGVRLWASLFLLLYLVGYVGVNLFTMGKVLHALLGWQILTGAVLVAVVSASYVTVGGQTSVIMTDLFQGFMLLGVGLVLLLLGVDYLGGFDIFWQHLPRGHRRAFPAFNADPSFSAVGIFWQDAMANTCMFLFLNQGMVMRFMAARTVHDARKAALFLPAVLMPIAACVVASGGWVAKALTHAGVLPADTSADEAFYIAADFLSSPGMFGLVIAALTAALMSTLDTLITAVSAVVVNDFYKPYVRTRASDHEYLRVARIAAVAVTLLGIALVPIFSQYKTIYAAHGAFTAAVTPPMVVTLLLSVFWRRFTRPAALATLVGGLIAIGLSLFVPSVIAPFAHGVQPGEAGEGLFGGMQQYQFMRAAYGLAVCTVIGVAVALCTRPESAERGRGLVWGTISDAIVRYKGRGGVERSGAWALARAKQTDHERLDPSTDWPVITISRALADAIDAEVGDLLYVTDARWWLGGLRSGHGIVGEVVDGNLAEVTLGSGLSAAIRPAPANAVIRVRRLYA